MRKMTVATLLSLMFLMAFSGCGGAAESDLEPPATATPTETPTETPTPTKVESPDPILMALATNLMEGHQVEIEKKRAEIEAIRADMLLKANEQNHNFKLTQASSNATLVAAYARDTQAAMPTPTLIPTSTPLPFQWTATVAVSKADIEKVTGEAELVTLAVMRQRMKNWMDAYLPWTLLVFAVIVGSVLAYIGAQVRTLKRDRNGLLGAYTEKKGGSTVVIRPDLMKTPYAKITGDGQVIEQGDPDDFQQATTRRQQMVEASKGRSVPEFQQVIRMLGGPSAPTGSVAYFDADRFFRGILQDAEEDLIEGEVTDVK
jgi:hypothetical protein